MILYSFKIKINHMDLFKSSLNYSIHQKSFFIDVIFSLIAFISLIYTLINGTFFEMDLLKKMLFIFCVILFPIIKPLVLYIKTIVPAKKMENIWINMDFYDKKINIYNDKENNNILYTDIYKICKYKSMIVLMYDNIHGQIMPDRYFNNNKDEFYNFILDKINEKRKENYC